MKLLSLLTTPRTSLHKHFSKNSKLTKNLPNANILATTFGIVTLVNAPSAIAFTLNTGNLINNGPQTGDGITVNYTQTRAGTGLDTSQCCTPSNVTGEPFPGDTDFTLLAGYSDVNDGNAFQDAARTIPTGNTDTPAFVDVDNYVNYNFSFSQPVDLTDFRIGDLDFDHDAEDDSYHDGITVIAQSPDGSFSVVSGGVVGSNLETYSATLVNNPDTGPDYLGNGISALVPYRNIDNSNAGVGSFIPSDDTVAVNYDSALQNISAVNVLYWSERNAVSANVSDLQGIAITGEIQVSATEVPFEFSPTLGLILTGLGIGIHRKSQQKKRDLTRN